MVNGLLEMPQTLFIVELASLARKCVSKRIIVKICTTRKNLTNSGVTSASYSSDIEVLRPAFYWRCVWNAAPVQRFGIKRQ